MKPWSGRAVKAARALVHARDLPGPCGRCGKTIDPDRDEWVVGHIKSRITYPSLTWDANNWRPEHRACSDRTGQEAVREKAAADALRAHGIEPPVSSPPTLSYQPPLLPFSLPEDQPRPRLTSSTKLAPGTATREPLDVRPDLGWEPEALAAWPWLRSFLDVPEDASPPLAMTRPHPDAVGSYGAEVVEWIEESQKIRLRWWQALAIVRQFEHREDGSLVWHEVLESAPRRAGKSVRIRGVALWRMSHAKKIGEVQTVIHCGNDLPICREIQRGAWRWAEARWGRDAVTKANGKEAIEGTDGSRWLVRSQDGVYGYDAGLAVVDEAWDVKPDTITEGLEPAMLERLWAQLHITSTAHRRATSLMKAKISAALAEDDGETLLLYWGALPQDDPGDPATWRKASPHWSEDRRRMIANKYDKAVLGETDPQADDPDPMEGFRAQYLNVWSLNAAKLARGTALADEITWGQLAAELPDRKPDTAAIESWFDEGVSLATAWRLEDGAAGVRVFAAPDLATAVAALDGIGYTGPLIVGKSMLTDPALKHRRTTGGAGTSLAAVLDLSRLLAEAQLVHDNSPTLTGQLLAVRTVPGADGPRLASQSRTDALKATAWATAAARARVPSKPRILVAKT